MSFRTSPLRLDPLGNAEREEVGVGDINGGVGEAMDSELTCTESCAAPIFPESSCALATSITCWPLNEVVSQSKV